MKLVDWTSIAAGHEPCRPTWDCAAGCGAWPCSTVKKLLRDNLAEQPLLTLLHYAYGAASGELSLTCGDVYRRMVRWF